MLDILFDVHVHPPLLFFTNCTLCRDGGAMDVSPMLNGKAVRVCERLSLFSERLAAPSAITGLIGSAVADPKEFKIF
ncbi:hypothetical protein [Planomicrobium sp. YIM 101495]|uniref:hypothetical protein n=1 Tax=Planomicrobium sp. YIM 101495 TaxID=2665160 RepID=UPI0018A974DB|nr:hypothetical protein [Planomicrobium sp. YIM 101495]